MKSPNMFTRGSNWAGQCITKCRLCTDAANFLEHKAN